MPLPACRLEMVEDVASQLLSLQQRLNTGEPQRRRVAQAVLDELRRYFGEDGAASARAALAMKLADFVTSLVEKETAMEGLPWWTEFLLNIEDARPFTKSNWANASMFEEAGKRS